MGTDVFAFQTLAWECEQKAREVDAMKEQMELADKRQRLEMDGIKNSLKVSLSSINLAIILTIKKGVLWCSASELIFVLGL